MDAVARPPFSERALVWLKKEALPLLVMLGLLAAADTVTLGSTSYSGVSSTGAVSINTTAGDLTVGSGVSTTGSSLVLGAGSATAVGTSTTPDPTPPNTITVVTPGASADITVTKVASASVAR